MKLFLLSWFAVTNALPLITTDTCPINALSCSSNAGGSCCSPTNGLVVLALQWVRQLGPEHAFTMHGLWPDTCSGAQTGENGCDASRRYPHVESILQANQTLYEDMQTYWASDQRNTNDVFWTHEWGKHGTCVTTLEPTCYANYQPHQEVLDYFSTALRLRSTYDMYTILANANIVPGNTYTLQHMETAIQNALGARPSITCNGTDLKDIRLYFHVQNTDHYLPTDNVDPSTCHGNINYPNKY